jgi:hypothetical protein
MQTVTFVSAVVQLLPAQPLEPASSAIVVIAVIVIVFLPPPVQAEAEGKTCHGVILFFQESGMAPDRFTQITGLLRGWRGGDQAALDLLSVLYDGVPTPGRRSKRRLGAPSTVLCFVRTR